MEQLQPDHKRYLNENVPGTLCAKWGQKCEKVQLVLTGNILKHQQLHIKPCTLNP